MSKIQKIQAREILDSRGNPTVEVNLVSDLGLFRASVPSGVSKGKYEALELRDGEKRYNGKGVLKAVKNVNEVIAPKLIGKNPTKQEEIDELMIELDSTENKSHLGANALLPVSMAVCRAGAKAENLPLYEYISKIAHTSFGTPSPVVLMIEGGLHAGNELDIQEIMIVLSSSSFSEKLRMSTEIYHTLGAILKEKYGSFSTNIGLEGGFAAPLFLSSEALDLVITAAERAGYKNKIKIVLDVAASHFYKNRVYQFEGRAFTKEGLLNFYSEIIKNYPILGIEDPFDQEDWEGWKMLSSKLKAQSSKFFIIGDDLTVTNQERIKKATKEDCLNAIVIKPNQIGTVTETIKAAKLAQESNLEIFVKHRSGETNDTFIADLAVGLGAKYIMAGAPTRGERVAKYNRLLKIEEELVNSK